MYRKKLERYTLWNDYNSKDVLHAIPQALTVVDCLSDDQS
jgi:hypothetical protein